MKTVKLLATLAILAGGAANAVTVSLNTDAGTTATSLPPPTAVNPASSGVDYSTLTFTNSGTSLTASSYFWSGNPNPNTWQKGSVIYFTSTNPETDLTANGTGLAATGPQNSNTTVDSGGKEFVLLDFGKVVTLDTVDLYVQTVKAPGKTWFSYAWLNSAPTAGSSTPSPVTSGSPTFALTLPFLYWDTNLSSYANATSPGTTFGAAGTYTFDFSTFGSGRYLMLGSSDITAGAPLRSQFLVQSVTWTSVPDGASTLALLGAAIGALGLATRRRRF